MKPSSNTRRIAIIGGGPAALYLLKTFLDTTQDDFSIDIFEAGAVTGSGFPYSSLGAGPEHITNVSGNEIPALVTTPSDWLKTLSPEVLQQYGITLAHFNDYHVFPRLLFGEYLHAQFDLLLKKAATGNIQVQVHTNCRVTDIIDQKEQGKTIVQSGSGSAAAFDNVIICTGHHWPITHEGVQPGFFDSPYPPEKIARTFNHPIAIKGSSLTAIDALRTLAKHNGVFSRSDKNRLVYTANKQSAQFSIVLHSLHGLLPGIRFHLADSHLEDSSLLTAAAIDKHRKENDGFLSLDFIFEKDFKLPLQKKDPAFYHHIRHMNMETFVEEMMTIREKADPLSLFRAEYEEARLSIQRKKSVHWKEMLAILSFAMNYPAKHFSAEDMLRLQKTLMPLIAIIIAFVPQESCEELLALHDAGRLSIVPVEKDSRVELAPDEGIVYHYTDENGQPVDAQYKTFIDCTGQPHLWLKELPFTSLVKEGTVSQALLSFRSAHDALATKQETPEKVMEDHNKYFLKVPGLAITDNFNVIGKNEQPNPRIYMMAVPFIGGYNPDYSGLDFGAEASAKIVGDIFNTCD